MSDFGKQSESLTPDQKLAIGLGDPSDLTTEQLRKFCEFVYPLESKCGFHFDKPKLQLEAERYLQHATGADLLRNFERMSLHDWQPIDARIKECAVEIHGIDATLTNLQTYLRRIKELDHIATNLLQEIEGVAYYVKESVPIPSRRKLR